MNKSKGFSLIELMIVICIIGILAGIAIPSYQNYMKKTQMVEVINVLNSAKSAIINYMDVNNGACPPQIMLLGQSLAQAGGAVIGTTISNNIVGVQYQANTNGCTAVVNVSPALGGGWPRLFIKPPASTGGEFFAYCGFLSNGTPDSGTPAGTTLNYMPSSCSLTNLSALGSS